MKDRIYIVLIVNGKTSVDLNEDGEIRTHAIKRDADARAEELVMAGKGDYLCCVAETLEARTYEAKVGRVPLRVPHEISFNNNQESPVIPDPITKSDFYENETMMSSIKLQPSAMCED